MQQLGVIIAAIVALIIVIAIVLWRRKVKAAKAVVSGIIGDVVKDANLLGSKAQLSGFGYAGCDGNYTWTGDFTPDGQLIFQADQYNLAKGQQASRLVTINKSGNLACYPPNSTSGGNYGYRVVGQNGVAFTYDQSLWSVADGAPVVSVGAYKFS